VVYVSWKEADEFCRWLSRKEGKTFRLPTEAEWEYAARGEDGRIYPWGDKLNAGNLANFADTRSNFVWRDPNIDDGFSESAPVGMYPRGSSPFGIEELSGNVFEWCLDAMDPYKGRELTNPPPSRLGQNRVYRGGSWKSRAASLRATARASNAPTSFSNDVGFRVMCECD
jgi:formylglycine-generating enzyme required for sulfatase activity